MPSVAMLHRSKLPKPDMRYSVEEQAPAGNWYPVLGTAHERTAVQHFLYLQNLGRTVRLVDEHK